MQFATFTRLITLGCYYSFAKQGGADGTVISTGVFTIPNSLFILTGCRSRVLGAGDPLAKLALGAVANPVGDFGTYSISFGSVLMTPQAVEVSQSSEILMQITGGDITAGEFDFTFMFLQSIR